MSQFKKMSRTLVAAAVLASIGSMASAGSISTTALNVAQEAWGTGKDASTVVTTTESIGYQFSTPGGIVINPGGTIHVTLTPANGKFLTAGSVTPPSGTGGVLTTSTATVNTTSGIIDIALINTGNTNSVIGVGAIVSVAGGTVNNVQGLATGIPMTATGSVGVATGGTELEAASAPGNIVTSSQAVLVSAATAATETAKIDVTTTTTANIGKVLTASLAGSLVETLGTVTFSNATTAAKDLDGTSVFNLANSTAYPTANTPVTYTLNLLSGSFSNGVVYSLMTGGCGSTGTEVTSTQTPAAILASTTSVTLSSLAVPENGSAISVCATFPGTQTINPYQASVAAVLTPAAGYVGETQAATAMYNLGYNGASVTVRNYIPAAVTGYQQTVRLINTGSSAAMAYVSVIDDVTGTATTPVAVGGVMAVGAAQRLSQATIEAAVGAIPASARPRLRFTAATGSMEAQSFFNNANGAYTNLNGQDSN
jgi:hypothetical protein